MSKNKLSIKQSVSYDDAVAYLEDLVKSFKVGKIVLQHGEEFISLSPGEHVDIELEAKRKKGKAKVELEIAWREAVEEGEELNITDKQPEPASEDEPEAVEAQAAKDQSAKSDKEEERRHGD